MTCFITNKLKNVIFLIDLNSILPVKNDFLTYKLAFLPRFRVAFVHISVKKCHA